MHAHFGSTSVSRARQKPTRSDTSPDESDHNKLTTHECSGALLR